MSSISPAMRLRAYLSELKERRLSSTDEGGASDVLEAKKHKTPEAVRRCVASVVNKGAKDSTAKPSDDEKSRAFAVCWDSHNKGELKKGFGDSKIGDARKRQYKALLKNPNP